ncbi:hypothetical protein LPJ61_005265, partial [Coemansia biformis]
MHGGSHRAEIDDELYQDPGSASSGSDGIDSDVEDHVLSHMYYRTAEDTAATSVPAPVDRPATPAARDGEGDDGEEESKYSIKPAERGSRGDHALNEAADAMDVDQGAESSSLSSSESEDGAAQEGPGNDSAAGTPRPAAGSDSEGATRGAASSTGVGASPGATMEHQVVRIDALPGSAAVSAQVPAGALAHAVPVTRARDLEDDEYGYLDEAEIQGRNRYFMEEKETICRKCKKAGHIAKDCTTVTCMVCGKDGHISKDCKLTGSVCHGCNMRGHMVSECPLRSGKRAPRASVCERCDSRNHHTEECATIWRRYVYAGPRPEKFNQVEAWCYNCAGDGHFGDDCRQPRARGANSFFGDTAFSSYNCPGK